jgi:hypothetical protein
MGHWYYVEVYLAGKQPLAVLFAAFVVTFLFIRLSTRMIRAEVKWWPGNVKPGGLHVHHVVFGIVFMLVAGAGGFSTLGAYAPWAEIFGGLFGCGAALVLDEFALVLHLQDVYWKEAGRTSVDAVFLAVAVFALLLLGVSPLGVNDGTDDESWGAYVAAIGLNAVLVGLTLVKGKIWTGLFGVLLPFLALIGAIRLARPGSPWARWRYRAGSKKHVRALRREVKQRRRWVERRKRLEDALAGRPP